MYMNFNSTKVQFGGNVDELLFFCQAHFNSTKVQFGAEANNTEYVHYLYFNSTKVQFGDLLFDLDCMS